MAGLSRWAPASTASWMRRTMRHSRRRASRGTGARRKLVWSTTNGLVSNAAAGNIAAVDLLSSLRTAGSSVLGCTVMRTLVTIQFETSVTAGDSFAYGILVDRVENVGNPAPAGAPNPNTMVDLDWAWLNPADVATKIANFPSYGFVGNNKIMFDVRARRKVEEMQQTWLFVGNPGISAVTPMNYQLTTRTLIALP